MLQVDERFQQTGITKLPQISGRSNISLYMPISGKDVQFKLDVYNLNTSGEKLDCLKIKLTPVSKMD